MGEEPGLVVLSLHERSMARYRVGRVLFSGDAAHLNPPSGGMGMNGGIHDAISGARALAAVIAGESDTVLDRWARQRHHAASHRIIPQAAANRKAMAATDAKLQEERLRQLAEDRSDPMKNREFCLRSSMIAGLDESATVA